MGGYYLVIEDMNYHNHVVRCISVSKEQALAWYSKHVSPYIQLAVIHMNISEDGSVTSEDCCIANY